MHNSKYFSETIGYKYVIIPMVVLPSRLELSGDELFSTGMVAGCSFIVVVQSINI